MNLINSYHRFQIIAAISAAFAIIFTAAGCKDTTNNLGRDSLSDPSVQPNVVSSVPASGTTGPFGLYNRGDGSGKPHFVLTFNKLMYKGSFTSTSFRIQGFDRPVSARVEGDNYYYFGALEKTNSTSSIYFDNVLSFFIVDSGDYYYNSVVNYRVGQSYAITLDSAVEDINGNHMLAPYSFTYTPEPYFRVVSMQPKNGSKDIAKSASISITLNSKVDASFPGKIQITPSIPGSWFRFYDSTYLSYQHSGRLPNSTTFTIKVEASATDAASHLIDHEYASTFSTSAFRPLSFMPRNGQSFVELSNYVEVDFSGSIDTGTIRSGFSLSPPVAGSLLIYSQMTYINFIPSYGFRPNTNYTITINPSLRGADGTASPPATSTFTTDAFRVTGYTPYYGSTSVPTTTTIRVWTNARLDSATIRPAISVSPAITGNISFTEGSGFFEFLPSAQLMTYTLYTVTISTGLKAKTGDNLLSPHTFSFTTGL